MHFHCNAATNHQQRRLIRSSSQSCRVLARQLCVSPATIHTWKHREEPWDRPCRPHNSPTALNEEEEQMVLWLRRSAQLSLDDLLDAVLPVLPHLSRSSLHRLLVRHGCNQLPAKQQQPTGEKAKGNFKAYGPGFLHIDCFYLPRLEGKRHYCFVAIDRATRLLFLHVYEHKTKKEATDFLERCLKFYPFTIHKILTDNGLEFSFATWRNRSGRAPRQIHPFTQTCLNWNIEQRQTKPYTPQTNGLVERANGLIKAGTTKVYTYQTIEEMKDDLQRWAVFYNCYRQHRRVGRITPCEAVRRWHQKQPQLFCIEPHQWLSLFFPACSLSTGT